VSRWAAKLAAQPELALHMTKTQFRGYAKTAFLGDATETDGDIISAAAQTEEARAAFSWGK
ncbi:MAG: hypothetical protein HKP27_03175, partial [Myxococcales bacterium]|nr:hypothetical protein [Myxococcales bacterium]